MSPDNEVAGAVHTVLAHPSNPDVVWAGAVNGGIWRTLNATAERPSWVSLTDDMPSLSIGALAMDPADPGRLLAGIGRFSSFGRAGGMRTGMLFSANSGDSWNAITDPLLVGQDFSGVALVGNTFLATSNLSLSVVDVNSPPTIAGRFVGGDADFGPSLGSMGVTADLKLANDGAGTPTDGCEPFPVGFFVGQIAVLDRGTCGLTEQVANAQTAEALAVLMVNNTSNSVWMPGMDPNIDIPSVIVGNSDGNRIKEALPGVNATLHGSGGGRLFRSTDGGNTWEQSSPADGLDASPIFDLATDPSSQGRFYVAVRGVGIFRSEDSGVTWTNVSANDTSTNGLHDTITGGGNNNTELSVASNGRLYAGVLIDAQVRYIGFTDDQGADWTAMNLPLVPEGVPTSILFASNQTPIQIISIDHGLETEDQVRISGVTGNTAANGVFAITVINQNVFSLNRSSGNGDSLGGGTWELVVSPNPRVKPGAQGQIHFSIAADPSDANTVYVGGDRQDLPFPTYTGAVNFTGNLWRGDTTVPPVATLPSPQWEHLTDDTGITGIPEGGTASGSAPHADSREMTFDANGDLIECSDGGIYRRTHPGDNTGDWFSMNGNLQITELHDIAYDRLSNVIFGGTQDNGTPMQSEPGSQSWELLTGGDGGDVAVDTTSAPGSSIRYVGTQFLRWLGTIVFDPDNVETGYQTRARNILSGGDPPEYQFVTPIELNLIDPTRIVIGGSNAVYESFDQGDNLTQLVGPGANENAMVYGHPSNADLLVVGSGNEVLVRASLGSGLVATPTRFPGATILDVLVDADSLSTLYAIDLTGAFLTGDGGQSWDEITGNLVALGAGEPRTLEIVPHATGSLLLLGGQTGIFVTATDTRGFWFELGSSLPNAPVYDLDYDASDDVLVAGTLGRGAWLLSDASLVTIPPVHGWEISGEASGGEIAFFVDSIPFTIPTLSGQSAGEVVRAIAEAINGDAALHDSGITAAPVANRAMTNGLASSATNSDSGLVVVPIPEPGRLLLIGTGFPFLLMLGRRRSRESRRRFRSSG